MTVSEMTMRQGSVLRYSAADTTCPKRASAGFCKSNKQQEPGEIPTLSFF